MQVDFSTAGEVFAKLPDHLKSPYFHPSYVLNDALRDSALEPVFFVYSDGGEFFYYAFHLGRVLETTFLDIQSPYAYGGPLASTVDPGFLAQAWQSYLAWCREHNVLAEFIRFHPLRKNWIYFPGEAQYLRETVWMDLQQEELFPSYSTRVRTAIRKAVKNSLRVEWVDPAQCYRAFLDLYTEAMTLLQAEQFYFFSPEYFQKLANWPQSYLAFCLQGEELLAAAFFLQEADLLEYHLAAASPEGKKYCAANLILDQAALLGKKLGCRMLHLGGGTDDGPHNPLLFFKSGFSSRRASFLIGKLIHAPAAYEKLQREWEEKYGKHKEKILFYRFPTNR